MSRIIITMSTKRTTVRRRRSFSSTPTNFECRTKSCFRSKTAKKSDPKTNSGTYGRKRNRCYRRIPAGTMTLRPGNPSGLWNVVIINRSSLGTMLTLKWQLFSSPFLGTDINDVTISENFNKNVTVIENDAKRHSLYNLYWKWRKWRHRCITLIEMT